MARNNRNQDSFELAYPYIVRWVMTHGWIEIGHDDSRYTQSFIRALDGGGMVWEGQGQYSTLSDAFKDLEAGLAEWMHEQRFPK